MPPKILAGDIGGTKTVLCVYDLHGSNVQIVRKDIFQSGLYSCFVELLYEFFEASDRIDAACFAVAGPVHGNKSSITNLSWAMDADSLVREMQMPAIRLVNDLEATAKGMLYLSSEELVELNPKAMDCTGHKAVIAPGTGLGEAILYSDGERHNAIATEGGHCDFAPQNAQDCDLLAYMQDRFDGHVSWERVIAGSGFSNIYSFLMEINFASESPHIRKEMENDDPNAVISRHGMLGDDALCTETLRHYCRFLGLETGNLALKSLPTGGIYIGGGIAPKIRLSLERSEFIEAFLSKGRMKNVLEPMSLQLCLNPEAPLLGAASEALKLLNHPPGYTIQFHQ